MIDMWSAILFIVTLIISIIAMVYSIRTISYNEGWWDCYNKMKKIQGKNAKD